MFQTFVLRLAFFLEIYNNDDDNDNDNDTTTTANKALIAIYTRCFTLLGNFYSNNEQNQYKFCANYNGKVVAMIPLQSSSLV